MICRRKTDFKKTFHSNLLEHMLVSNRKQIGINKLEKLLQNS